MSKISSSIMCLIAATSFQFGVLANENQGAVERLINNHNTIAKISKVTVSANLEDSDTGVIKEFGIKIGHHYFNNKKISKIHRGKVFETELISFLGKKDIEVSAKELDEYHGMSIDALIALPFSYFNPDDIYLEPTIVSLIGTSNSVKGGYGNDTIEFTVGEAKEITGQELFLRMNKDVKGCKLDKSIYALSAVSEENQVKCRNLKSSIYVLHLSGFSEAEIKEILVELEPNAREDQLGYKIGSLDWYKRNYDKR